MDSDFIKSLQDLAMAKRARIGIGIWNADADLIASLQSAEKYADLLLVGEPCCDCSFDYIPAKEPWKELVRLLADRRDRWRGAREPACRKDHASPGRAVRHQG